MKLTGDSRSAEKSQAILVVEDEPDVRRSAVEALLAMGYRTIEAADSGQALGQLERHSDIDLLLTDVRMPGAMDGAELAFTVRSRWPTMGIVVLSGYFDPTMSRLPRGVGFLAKPYRIKELQEVIDQQLHSRLVEATKA